MGSKTGLADWVTLSNAAALVAAYYVYKLIYALYLSPLRNVPGPLFSKTSGLSSLFMDMAGSRAKTIEALHDKYGPVVQVGPNEVSFNAVDAVDIIYGPQSVCIKSPWYDNVTRDGVFKLRNVADHRHRRRQISRAFSPAVANDLEQSTVGLVQEFADIIEQRRQKGALEMRHWFRMLVFDLAGIAFVGTPNGGLECEKSPQFVSDMDNAFLIWDLEGRFPLLMWLVERIPIKSFQHILNGTNRLYDYSTAAFEKYIGLYGRAPERKDIVSKLLETPSNGVQRLSDDLIKCEIANLTFAATDTTSIVLSFLFWELAQHPELQEQLRSELQQLPVAPGSNIPAQKTLANLPFLNAVIQETMRRHSPIPMGLLRQTPPGGCVIEGYFIPGETVVSMSSWLSQRDPKVFPDPDSFQPSRWTSEKSDTVAADGEGLGGSDAMRKMYMPFGKGRHKCAGQAMAMVTMRIIVASLVLKFNVKLAKDAKPADMEWDDHFLIMLRRGCFLDFTPV